MIPAEKAEHLKQAVALIRLPYPALAETIVAYPTNDLRVLLASLREKYPEFALKFKLSKGIWNFPISRMTRDQVYREILAYKAELMPKGAVMRGVRAPAKRAVVRKGLFTPPKDALGRQHSKMVDLRTVKGAHIAVAKFMEEAHTRGDIIRLIRSANEAANIAGTMSRNPRISKPVQVQKAHIERIYRQLVQDLEALK